VTGRSRGVPANSRRPVQRKRIERHLEKPTIIQTAHGAGYRYQP
jgi:DNA-binding response OmpR family regulator